MRYDLCIRPVLNCIYIGTNSRILRASTIFGFFELVFYAFEFPFWYPVRSVLDIVFLGCARTAYTFLLSLILRLHPKSETVVTSMDERDNKSSQ